MITLLLLLAVAGSIVYCVLAVVAVRDYLAHRVEIPPELPAISILKPLAGAEPGLERNLRTFFEQDYPAFEILLAVRSPDDAAIPVVEKLRGEFPQVASRLIVTGEPPYPNAKVYSLDQMKSAARHELLAMSDSDIRVTPEFLKVVAAEFVDARAGLSTCPYRAVPGLGFWSKLEALGINTQFMSGVIVARFIEGMKFALGPTIVARRAVLDEMGGFDRLKDYLAEDFVMGKFAAELGYQVVLSTYVIEHHIGSHGFRENLDHRLRWARSTRCSRPKGYLGEFFTMPVPLALMLLLWKPATWPVVAVALAGRFVYAWFCAEGVLHDPLTRSNWWLLPVQDMLAFGVWIAGFFGETITWRGRQYRLLEDGRFEPAGSLQSRDDITPEPRP
ncbi:MAG: bacteriohopanetetrol glucosamine biosynthesis glycosyltransferase HpnI [Bryobacteraceae bacterium]